MVDEAGSPPPSPLAKSKVVRLADAVAAKEAAQAGAQPTPSDLETGANAPDSGAGGDASAIDPATEGAVVKKGKGEKKTERTIDWGSFNSLVKNFALIYGTDTVWDGTERMIMKISNMGHAHGSEMVRLWKGSDRRRTVLPQDVVFDPTETCDRERCVNLFHGLEMEPKQGDVEPMLDLIRYLTSRASEHDQENDNIFHWLMCWLAYPLQNMGAKMRTSIVMHGDEGAGKNFLFDTVVAIYGKYGALVGQDELEDKFNDWRSCKLFVVGDEVSSRAELVHNKNRLKALITSPTVQINPKNLPRREEANHINIVFLSNELQPLALDNSDRRYLVVYTPRAKPVDYYKRLGEWKSAGGVEAFYHYLLTYPVDDFDPYSPAPFTEAKRALIGINRKSPEQFWWEWSSGELDLPYQTCSVAQAYKAYLKYCVRTGERYPFKREQFTPTVVRFSESLDKPVQIKQMKVEAALGAPKKVERMFLVTALPEHVQQGWARAEAGEEVQTQGQWASECVHKFEEHLKVYLGWNPRSPGGDEPAHGGDE